MKKNKWLVLLCCAALLMTAVSAGSSGPLLEGGTVVWSDEFDGDELDLTKWNIETGTGGQYGLQGWGNQEKQFYKPDNISVQDGVLVIEARKDNDKASGGDNFPYTSGKISSGGIMNADGTIKSEKFTVKPGQRIEARIKSPRGKGLWPAFWLIGATSNEYGAGGLKAKKGWPRAGEIDILEIKGGRENILLSTIHYGPQWPDNRATGDQIELDVNLADDYHIYGVVWNKNELHFMLDGKSWQKIDLVQIQKDYKKSFIKEGYAAKTGFAININFAVGGQFIGNALPADSIFDASAPLEDRQYKIDWVRVYQ